MAKSQQTFGKSEREKKRLKKRKDKQLKKEERKVSGLQNNEFVYVDEFGQLTNTPPDPSKKLKVDVESIEIGVPKKEDREEEDPIKKGKVSFFDSSKGFGFIIDNDSQEKYFVHVSGMTEEVGENDKVSFELERGLKGMNAVRVKKI